MRRFLFTLTVASCLVSCLPGKASDLPAGLKSQASELTLAAEKFKEQATDGSWAEFSQAMKAALAACGSEPSVFIKNNPELSDLGVKVISSGCLHLWSFPEIEQSRSVLVQWKQTRMVPVRVRHRAKRLVSTCISRVESLDLPSGVTLKDGRIFDLPGIQEKKAKPEKNCYLILTGLRQTGGGMWLASYRLNHTWSPDNAPLAAVPPFLASNISGLIGFSGSDLTVTITPSARAASANGTSGKDELPEAPSSSYKLVLHLVGSKFILNGSQATDTPYNAARQFVAALSQGRLDLASAWLADASLISIPKYIAATGKVSEKPMRLIGMSSPYVTGYRYRLVTFARYDLIIDVARIKDHWVVKSLFIAHGDPLLQKIAGSLAD